MKKTGLFKKRDVPKKKTKKKKWFAHFLTGLVFRSTFFKKSLVFKKLSSIRKDSVV